MDIAAPDKQKYSLVSCDVVAFVQRRRVLSPRFTALLTKTTMARCSRSPSAPRVLSRAPLAKYRLEEAHPPSKVASAHRGWPS